MSNRERNQWFFENKGTNNSIHIDYSDNYGVKFNVPFPPNQKTSIINKATKGSMTISGLFPVRRMEIGINWDLTGNEFVQYGVTMTDTDIILSKLNPGSITVERKEIQRSHTQDILGSTNENFRRVL